MGRIVFVCGVWDLFHVGHLRMLQEAKKLGDILIVGVATDEFAQTYKEKPIIPFEQREEIVGGLGCVDATYPHHYASQVNPVKAWGGAVRAVGPEFGVLEGAICAAGWKGYIQKALGATEWGIKLPEALIPLGAETILSRAVRQLKERGASEVYVGVGVPGKCSPVYEGWLHRGGYEKGERTFEVEFGAEIWTQERLDYVDSLDCVSVPMTEFDSTGATFTVAKLLEAILRSGRGFDQILVTMGDYVMVDGAIDIILKLEAPCMWCPQDLHQGWLVDRNAAEFLSGWLAGAGHCERSHRLWYLWESLSVLGRHGIKIHTNIFPGAPCLIEVEDPESYLVAKKMIGVA